MRVRNPSMGFRPFSWASTHPTITDHWLLVTDMRFKDRVALITAAASGIGRASAEIMAREGGVVVAVDKDAERLDEMVAGMRASQGRVHARKADVLDPRQVDALVPEVAQEFGAIDILVNAVGGSTIIAKSNATVDELSFADWQSLIAFNLEGTFLFCHAVTPVMKGQRRGKIVNLASIAGRGLSNSSSSAYAAAKGGIIAFTRKLSFELSFADWQSLIAFNLEGTFLFCHAVTPVMKGQRRGKIVNLA